MIATLIVFPAAQANGAAKHAIRKSTAGIRFIIHPRFRNWNLPEEEEYSSSRKPAATSRQK
jgi:hypothetical protein